MGTRGQNERPKLVIHGGAGTISRAEMTAAMEQEFREALESILQRGFKVLQEGGSSLDAVETAVRGLEDCPLFNAGRGSVFTHAGTTEMDASIMEGTGLSAGAVAAITTAKNPVTVARAVMEKTPHVLLAGSGADDFAREFGLELVTPSYFHTEVRWMQLQEELEKERTAGVSEKGWTTALSERSNVGTVGAVAVDRHGHLAAATSTGGMTNKRFGRVGDSPVIGSGTYADDAVCAVSATGHGEFFLRYVVAHDIWALVKYKELPLPRAAETVVEKLRAAGAEGGVIALDAAGNHALTFNSTGMYRGWMTNDDWHVGIFRGE